MSALSERLLLLALTTVLFVTSFTPHLGGLAFSLLQFTMLGEAVQRFLNWKTKDIERLALSAGIGFATLPLAVAVCHSGCAVWIVSVYIITTLLLLVSKPQPPEIRLRIDVPSLSMYFAVLGVTLIATYLLRSWVLYPVLGVLITILIFVNYKKPSELLHILTIMYIFITVSTHRYMTAIFAEMFNLPMEVAIGEGHKLFFGYVASIYIMQFYNVSVLTSLSILFYQSILLYYALSMIFNSFIKKILVSLILTKYGFPISATFGLLALSFMLKEKRRNAILALLLSLLYGTRGLILAGLPLFLSLRKDWRTTLFAGLTLILSLLLLNKYILNYFNILNSFASSFTLDIDHIIKVLITFFTRERLQPNIDFYIMVAALSIPTVLSLALVIQNDKKIRIFSLSSIALFMLFIIFFLITRSIFENFASDIPYYFLYSASLLGFLALALYRQETTKRLALPLVVLLFIALIPKYFHVAYYENTFMNIPEYISLLVTLRNMFTDGTLLYDYGSYSYSALIRPYGNSIMVAEWASADRYLSMERPIYYIGSENITTLRMFYYLPHVQRSWQLVLKNKIIDAGTYCVFILR